MGKSKSKKIDAIEIRIEGHLANFASDPAVAKGYGPQPTILERQLAQKALLQKIDSVAYDFDVSELAKLISRIAPDDKRITKLLSKHRYDNVRQALALSTRPMGPKTIAALLIDDCAPVIAAMVISGRPTPDQIRETLQAVKEDSLLQVRANSSEQVQEFFVGLLKSDYPLSTDDIDFIVNGALFSELDARDRKLILKALAETDRELSEPILAQMLDMEDVAIDTALARSSRKMSDETFRILRGRDNTALIRTMMGNPALSGHTTVAAPYLALVRAS